MQIYAGLFRNYLWDLSYNLSLGVINMLPLGRMQITPKDISIEVGGMDLISRAALYTLPYQ